VEALQGVESIPFGPGLNVVWGRNGVGKSTLLKVISHIFCCTQSGRPFVSETALRTIQHVSGGGVEDKPINGVIPIHDGQAVLSLDLDLRVGLAHRGTEFDYDFIRHMHESMGMQNLSSGQCVAAATVQQIISNMKEWPDIEYKIKNQPLNDYWRKRVQKVEDLLQAQIEKGPTTLLLDEPDKSLDIDSQYNFWLEVIPTLMKNHQVIVATHNPLALQVKGANIVEIKHPKEEGLSYLEKCKTFLGLTR